MQSVETSPGRRNEIPLKIEKHNREHDDGHDSYVFFLSSYGILCDI